MEYYYFCLGRRVGLRLGMDVELAWGERGRKGGKEGLLEGLLPRVCVSRESAGALVQDGSHLLMILYSKISCLLIDKGEEQLKN